MIRFCKCGHNPEVHENRFIKGKPNTWEESNKFRMININNGIADHYKRCDCENCNCKSYRPESNKERETRLI